MNFYYSHWGGQINDIILITAVLTDQISKFIKSEYPGFKVNLVNSADNFHGVWGAALRGLASRVQDEDINLMSEKVINAFWRDQVVNFIGIWRNVVFAVTGFILIVFIAANLFLIQERERVEKVSAVNLEDSEMSELVVLQSKVLEFNNLVKAATSANDLTNDVAPFIKKINSVASGSGITIIRFGISTTSLDVNLSGSAGTQEQIIDFRKEIEQLENVSESNLPFSSITSDSSGGFAFTMTFKLKTLKGF